MNIRLLALMVGLLSLSACQNAPVNPVSNVTAPAGGQPAPVIGAITAESCKSTLESYMRAIQAHPEKYTEENLAVYPEVMQYSNTLHECQKKGFLSPKDMMQVAEKMNADAEAAVPDAEAAHSDLTTDTEQ